MPGEILVSGGLLALLKVFQQLHYWLLLGREPHSRSELLMVYAAALAHGTSMSAADLSRMVPELSASAIRQMMHRIAVERNLRQAADAVLAFMHRTNASPRGIVL